ncbi:MAG: TonB-dependent receptor [Pseudomonadota bacterium]
MRSNFLFATSLAGTALFAPPVIAIAAAQEAESDRLLGTVTVTAQRVEENLQDVPVAVTALDATQLEDKQVQNVRDLTAFVPNINIATNTGTASAARIFLRGVGEDESRGAVDQAVGIYVDGVYIGRSVGSLFDVVDLEQLEVLRGPQGTLYGRNTIGGAIKLTSVRPQMENSGNVLVTAGNEGRFDIRGTGNFQFAERTAIRITGLNRQRDGFHEVIPNGPLEGAGREVGKLDTLSLRASVLHEFTDDWRLLFAVDHTDDQSDPIPDSVAPGNDVDNDIFTIEPLPGTECPATGGFIGFPIGCFTEYDQELQTTGVSARVEGRFGPLDFTSISAHRQLNDELSTRIGFPFSQETDQDQFSQEFTLGFNEGGPLEWLAGLYYFEEDISLDSVFIFPFSIDSTTESFAVFGQGTYNVTDALALTAGVRYTDETKDFDGLAIVSGLNRVESADFENVSYTVGADYRFTDGILGYAKYSTGFKSGGWSADAFSPAAVFLPVDEETLESAEIGIKSDFADVLRVNIAAFFNRYDDLQIGATVPGLGFTRFNVDETEIAGLEVEAIWQATQNLQFNGNLGLLDAEYTSVIGNQGGGLTNDGAGCPAGSIPVLGEMPSMADIEARQEALNDCARDLDLKNAPEFKATVGALYAQPIYQGELVFSGDVAFEDDSFSLVANSPPHSRIEIDPLVNARIKYTDDRGWSVAVWGRNLTDQEYYRASSAASFTTYASEPLTWGVDLGYTF